jgi:hypothetical protein
MGENFEPTILGVGLLKDAGESIIEANSFATIKFFTKPSNFAGVVTAGSGARSESRDTAR